MRMSHRRSLYAQGGKVVLSYSGAHTVSDVTYGGVTYEQWTFTSSGTLSIVSGKVPTGCKVCVVGGGASGRTQDGTYSAGAGAFLVNTDVSITGPIAVAIGTGGANVTAGAAGGASSFGSVTAGGGHAPAIINASSPASGTGAGNMGTIAQKGDGVPKYPFGDTAAFSGRPHCGGGAAAPYNGNPMGSADGGTNGGAGGVSSSVSTNGSGGIYGGGSSGMQVGGSASFYGSGGANGVNISILGQQLNGGTGYQGVVYLRVPKG